MNNPIRRAFDPVRASDDTLEEVLKRIQDQGPRHFPLTRALAVWAAALLLLAFTACAADYVLNHREIFFFDTLEALAARQTQENPNAAVSCAIPAPAEEAADLETSVEYVARALEDGLLGEERVVDQGQEADGTRWVIRESDDPLYGKVTTEYRACPAYARELLVDGLLQWDLSCLGEQLTPDQNGQILVSCRSRDSGEPLWTKAHLGYTTGEGRRFSLSFTWDTTWDYGRPDYILSDAYDSSEVFVTDDQTETLILSYQGQVWVKAAGGHRSVDIYTTGFTVEEMKDLLNRLSLSSALE